MILDPGRPAVQAIFLKGHLRCLAFGLKNSRYSGKEILTRVSVLTGKMYGRGKYEEAIQDLQIIIETERN